jgi:PhzF family phenazine biosynthesis protein
MGLVDAFADGPFKGNPAGVCVVDTFPEDAVMQNIAFELNWSETAFVKKISENTFHIRWFAPEDEAPICGHATLAAAYFLIENKFVIGSLVVFKSAAGLLTVRKEEKGQSSWLVMDFPVLHFDVCDSESEVNAVASIFNEGESKVKIKQVLKDSLIYIAVLSSEDEVANCVPNLERLKMLPCRAVSVTAQADSHHDYDFVSRYFAPKVGISEDPVCGSAHCRLTPFWANVLKKDYLTARQLSRRGGSLQLSYCRDTKRVSIAGQASTILRGEVAI